jgi:hypothetical protein
MAGSSVIGALRVNLGIDTAQFSDGLKQAQSSADKFAAVLKTTMVAAAAAATAALGAIAVGVRSTLNTVDDMSKMAAKIGIPIEELSKLKYAADMSGVSLEGLQTSVSRLSRNMADAAKGTGAGAEAFKQVGISATKADGSLKSSSQVMAEIADKFAVMPDGAKKTALAMQLMGKSGADMIPLLNGGSAALNEMLVEAKELGLEISAKTGLAAEQFNDNISRMGYAVSGLTLGLTAALAPALVIVSDAMVQFTKWVLGAVDYLPIVGEYASVAGGALAIMFSPAILAAASNLAVAIGVGLVGAVRLLTAAIAANPLGALAIGITIAITAIYHFRDEIQKAIGVDVVGIAKDAANLVIGSFVAAFEDIKFIWNQFPNIIGAAVIGAVNAVVAGIEMMIQKAAGLVDGLIDKVNGALSMIPGADLQIGKIGEISFGGPIKNPYADALGKAVGDRNTAVNTAMNTDYIGAIGQAFSGATPAAENFAGALSGVNGQLEDMGGDGGGKGKAGKLDKVKEGIKGAATEMERFVESIASTMSNAFQGLIDGSKSVKETIGDLLKQLSSMLMNEGFKALVGGLFGGGGGLGGGGFLSGLFGGLLGFQNGGSFKVGGAGGIDSQVVAFRASPNERVDITKPGQERGGGGVADVRLFVDQDGNWQAKVERISQRTASNVTRQGIAAYDKQLDRSLGGKIAQAQTRQL